MAKSIREQILSAKDINSQKVDIPEWGVKVEVRGLSGAARNRILSKAIDSKGNIDLDAMYPDLVIASTFDAESGEPVFGAEDRDALYAKSGKALERITKVAMELSGLDEDNVDVKVKN